MLHGIFEQFTLPVFSISWSSAYPPYIPPHLTSPSHHSPRPVSAANWK